MTPVPPLSVRTTSAFDRDFRKLAKQHRDLIEHFERAITILEKDPYNRSRIHNIKKLHGVPAGEGQFRLRLGRFRFRYDIAGRVVTLVACNLRREDTYL
jgi:mRNA-degrading endonuclease RelE of RelBE toxin-antitoxin system